jgi:hypothetical protein
MKNKVNNPISIFFTMVMCFLFSVCESKGQDPVAASGQKGGMGYFMIGACLMNLDNLNSRLTDNGYTGLSDNFFTLGGGGHAILNRMIIGGEGQAMLGDRETGGTFKTSLGGGYGLFNLGYVVYSTGSIRIYPLLGIGGGGVNLGIYEQGIAPSFDEVLQDPRRNADLFTGGFLLSFAIGTEYFLKTGTDEEEESGWIFGIRAGYTLTPIQGDWHISETVVSAGPDLGITGPYLRIMIGGGGFEKNK